MTTYDLATGSAPTKLAVGDIINCSYCGAVKSVTLPKGEYKLEVWGAQGGTYSSYGGGYGGYSVGTLTLSAPTTVYCCTGGQPAQATSSTTVAGGYNGGGSARRFYYSSTYSYAQPGGGATHIALDDGLLSTFSSKYSSKLLLCAGGGGGSSSVDAKTTKYGGGTQGASPGGNSYIGTQSSAGTGGSFGQGGNSTASTNCKYGCGGGGGGFYGGGAYTSSSDSSSAIRGYNGGGSGWVNSTLLTSAGTYGYNNGSQYARSGNGLVTITVVKLQSVTMWARSGGLWRKAMAGWTYNAQSRRWFPFTGGEVFGQSKITINYQCNVDFTGTVTLNGQTQSFTVSGGTGQSVFWVENLGTYPLTYGDLPVKYSAGLKSVTIDQIGDYIYTCKISSGFKFTMNYNASNFVSNPDACLSYADDCAGFTPVSGPGSSGSSPATCTTIGDWLMKADGTSDNPLLEKCFYATFDSNGALHEKLNPQNLSQKIATWNGSDWVAASGASSITTEDTMFCIPTLYLNSTASSVSISSREDEGVAYAHTIGGHTYKYLAIGVYEGYNNSSKLMSWSGKVSTASVTRPNFRTYATSKTVQNGHAMLWNFYQWNIMRIMIFFAMRHFNGQSKIGQGGLTYNGAGLQGQCNAMGPFAGSSSTTAATTQSVKAFIENPWGYKYEFIDDFVVKTTSGSNHEVWVGQNVTPNDTYNSDKTKIITSTVAGGNWQYASAISTSPKSWGFITTGGASVTTGLCDGVYFNNSSGQYLGSVGGSSGGVSGGYAGPSCLSASGALSGSAADSGARLAFVFD